MSRDPIFDASTRTRAFRTIITEDGTPAIERRPIQKSILAVNPSGHVCWMPLYTGPKQLAEDNPYKHAILYTKQKYGTARSKKPGWLPLGVCPQSHPDGARNLPESHRGKPVCRTGSKGGPVSQDNPCSCVLAAIAERRRINAIEQAELNNALKSAPERTAEAHAEAIQAAREASQAAREVIERNDRGKGQGR